MQIDRFISFLCEPFSLSSLSLILFSLSIILPSLPLPLPLFRAIKKIIQQFPVEYISFNDTWNNNEDTHFGIRMAWTQISAHI